MEPDLAQFSGPRPNETEAIVNPGALLGENFEKTRTGAGLLFDCHGG
jgi:hypothetical protein